MLLSRSAGDFAIAAAAGFVLTLAFPKAGAAWLVPFGTAALFWTWRTASWKRAFALGWLGGWLFFSTSYAWWTYTISHDVGEFWAYAAVLIAGAYEALAWGATAILTVFARRRAPAALVPLATAAAFALMESLRSVGLLGVPFAQLGYTQAGTPLRIFAAYIGTYGVTFVLCASGAYLADAVDRRKLRPLLSFAVVLGVAWSACWFWWPARRTAAPTIPVAAVQGNIVQTLKWRPGSLALAVNRYTSMTRTAFGGGARLVVWPETVIAERGTGLNDDPLLESRFASLARAGNATIVVGSIGVHDESFYNSLFFFTPNHPIDEYDKRQLVPFAENFPGSRFLYWIPYVGSLNGGFAQGTNDGVYPTAAGLVVAPLICWESTFADLIHAQVARGAQLLVVSTDDAWFGETNGPFQHAQISQMRAVENGMWLVRAAATGVTGIIAPDGRWTQQAPMDEQTTVAGLVGRPPGSLFARIGPAPVVAGLALLYLAIVMPRRRRRVP
jgi:apolipoprotein N-acyltransferase